MLHIKKLTPGFHMNDRTGRRIAEIIFAEPCDRNDRNDRNDRKANRFHMIANNRKIGDLFFKSKIHSDEGLTLTTSVFESFAVTNLHYRPCG